MARVRYIKSIMEIQQVGYDVEGFHCYSRTLSVCVCVYIYIYILQVGFFERSCDIENIKLSRRGTNWRNSNRMSAEA